MKSWSGSCPETKATRTTIHPKLDPIVDFRTVADTEPTWATNGREANVIVGMSETEVIQILDNFLKLCIIS